MPPAVGSNVDDNLTAHSALPAISQMLIYYLMQLPCVTYILAVAKDILSPEGKVVIAPRRFGAARRCNDNGAARHVLP